MLDRRQRPGESKNWLITPMCSEFEGWSDEKFLNELMASEEVKAVALQREVSPSGTDHMQIFVITARKKRETAMRNLVLLGHDRVDIRMADNKWEVMKHYCTKEFYEDDHPEHPGCRKRKEGHEALEVSV